MINRISCSTEFSQALIRDLHSYSDALWIQALRNRRYASKSLTTTYDDDPSMWHYPNLAGINETPEQRFFSLSGPDKRERERKETAGFGSLMHCLMNQVNVELRWSFALRSAGSLSISPETYGMHPGYLTTVRAICHCQQYVSVLLCLDRFFGTPVSTLWSQHFT